MKTIEIKKMIKGRAGTSKDNANVITNYSLIKNIKWSLKRGKATKNLDDVITFDYKGHKYRLESKYTGVHSVIQEHKLVTIE